MPYITAKIDKTGILTIPIRHKRLLTVTNLFVFGYSIKNKLTI
ncbi:hypothetical protein [Carnobacterium sp.]